MSSSGGGILAAAALLALALPATGAAQGIHRELGVEAISLLGDRDAVGGGVFAAVRPGARARISLLAAGGGVAGRGFARGELLAHFLLAPGKRRGVAPYLAGGLAVMTASRTDARIVALLGFEGRPGARTGWVVEGGVGGGWRVAAGWRWRR